MIEVRTAKGESLVLTTVEWTKESRRYAINQILRLEGFAKPALDESPKAQVATAHYGAGPRCDLPPHQYTGVMQITSLPA